VTTLCDSGGCVGTAIGHFSVGLSQFHGHGSWLMCEVALSYSGGRCVFFSKGRNPAGKKEGRGYV
jgi:hypothetical protein